LDDKENNKSTKEHKMEKRVKSEIRYQCPGCRETISETAMLALREAHEASYHNCLHCRQAAFSTFVRVQWIDVLVWDQAGELAYEQCSFETRLLGDEREPARSVVGSFEWLVAKNLQALVAADSQFIQTGVLGELGEVRYISYSDLAVAINALLKCDTGDGKSRTAVKARTIGAVSRDSLGLLTWRADEGWVVVLDPDRLKKMAEMFGLGQLNLSATPGEDALERND
jgi:hypothetical protein